MTADETTRRASEAGDRLARKAVEDSPATGSKQKKPNRTTRNDVLNKNWLKALLFMFTLSLIGMVISILTGSSIPLWLLLGFSTVFSIEKWFNYITRKYKTIGMLYRLLLNLSILSLLGLLIWSGIKLFSQQFVHSPLTGSLIFLAEFVLFIWMWIVVSKNSWRWPSMKLTMFSLIVLFLILAFAGAQPMKSFKDASFSAIGSVFDNLSESIAQAPKSTVANTPTTTPTHILIPTPSTTKYVGIDPRTGKYLDYYLGLVKGPDGPIGNCYG
jgi:hypothetical protein